MTCLISSVFAGSPSWEVLPSGYQYNANITCIVYVDGVVSQDSMNILGSFVNDSVRGVASPIHVNGTWMYFLTVYSNSARGEFLSFRFYHAGLDTIIGMQETTSFVADTLIGDPISPFILHASTSTSEIQMLQTMDAGWNLISIPLEIQSSAKTVVYPTAISDAFIFSNGYLVKSQLENGNGYWIKFPPDSAQRKILMSGKEKNLDTISVNAGWNLVGSISSPINIESVHSVGTSITSSWYEFHNGYQAVDTIKPGNGYWIKVTVPGSIIFTSQKGSEQ